MFLIVNNKIHFQKKLAKKIHFQKRENILLNKTCLLKLKVEGDSIIYSTRLMG